MDNENTQRVYEFKHRRRVEFSDTDMAGIMHFSRFFVYMESAEHAFIRSLGLSIHWHKDGQLYGWPRIDAGCQYKRPLKFEDEVEIHLKIETITEKTIVYRFVFRKLNGDAPEEVAFGHLKTICVAMNEETREMRSVEMPQVISGKIEVAPEYRKKE